MLAELGHFALILGLVVAVLQMISGYWGAHVENRNAMRVSVFSAVTLFGLVGLSFAALVYSFIVSDFSLKLVFENSHSSKPMLYKFSGTWGNHEGSMLLWLLILTLFGAAAAAFGSNIPKTLRARVLATQGVLSVAFALFILLTSNPFIRLELVPFDGQDLNPLLQDPGLAFHPPFLYLGYVGLSMAYSFAVAGLIEGRIDAAWARWVRPWTLAAWMFLTVGIALGSWWAYYELGWGGFWFWDPVENASFMPWLFATALLHSAIVVEKRETLKSWTVLLAIIAFGFSLLGTFIVRSGVITSVHAFANDPERGMFILALMGLFVGGALILFVFRSNVLTSGGIFAVVSRESALLANNIILSISAFVVLVGTLWPLIAEVVIGETMSVGAPFFNIVFTPFFFALALILPLGSMLAWKRGNLKRVFKAQIPAAIFTLACILLGYAMLSGRSSFGPIAVGFGAWVVFGAGVDLWSRAKANSLSQKLGRLFRMPRADWGKFTAHVGMGVTIIGIAVLLTWQTEDIRIAEFDSPYSVGSYEVTLRSAEQVQGPNYVSVTGHVDVTKNSGTAFSLYPEKRFYQVAEMPTTEAAIDNGFFRDLYVVLGDAQGDTGYTVRFFIKPFANWIWGGAGLMAIGALLSLSDRRFRVAAGAKRANTRVKRVLAE